MEKWAFIVGLVLGGGAVASVCYTWIRQARFGAGGAGLGIIGIILVGLPIWASISIEISGSGASAQLERRIGGVAEASRIMLGEFENLVSRVDSLEACSFAADPGGGTHGYEAAMTAMRSAPKVNQDNLRRAADLLKPAPPQQSP